MEYPEERREQIPVEAGGMYKPNFRGVHRLNRDEQGRLRRKMVVLKIENWLAGRLREVVGLPPLAGGSLYQIDMSSKNPRFLRKIWTNDQLPSLHEAR